MSRSPRSESGATGTEEVDFSDFVSLLAPALREAAATAHRLEGSVTNQPKSGESTAVKQALTEADTAAQEQILAALHRHFPQVGLEAEEETPSVALFPDDPDACVVIDPIDGTLHSYLRRTGPYAVIVGLALKREVRASLVALPREGLLFVATRGRGASHARAGTELRGLNALDRSHDSETRVLVSHGVPDAVFDSLREQGLDPVPSCGGAVAVAPLIAGVRAGVRHAGGPRGISIRGRIGALISREAGLHVRTCGGDEFPSDLDTPASTLLVAREDEDLAKLETALGAGGLA